MSKLRYASTDLSGDAKGFLLDLIESRYTAVNLRSIFVKSFFQQKVVYLSSQEELSITTFSP